MNKDKFVMTNKYAVTSEYKIKYLEEILFREKVRLNSLMVIYHPSCGCELDQFVLLDRYPMSEKIISTCPGCNQPGHMELSDPLAFYLPVTEEIYFLEDLKNMVITDTPQKSFIEAYVNSILP